MKKVLFAVALVMGLGSSVAFAGNMVSDVEIVVLVNDYKPIEVKDLPQAVQDLSLIHISNRKSFSKQTTVSVATEGGFFYSFNVTYACLLYTSPKFILQ